MNGIETWISDFLKDEQCKITVRKAGTYRFPSTYIYQAHKHVEYEVNYISSGNSVMIFEGEQVPLKTGECIVIPPFINHGFLVDTRKGCKIRQAEMSIQVSDKIKKLLPLFGEGSSYMKIKDCEDAAFLIEQIARTFRKEENEYNVMMTDLTVLQLMITLWNHKEKYESTLGGSANKKISGIMQYLRDHYNEPVQIERLADEWEVSSRYIRKYFEENVGMSCMDYITAMRMNRARELLWESTKSITEIAMETGYGTSQYFCRMFKKEMGMTPSEYRSAWKEKKFLQVYAMEEK